MAKVRVIIFACCIVFSAAFITYSQVYINEFQAANGSSALDPEFNEFSDWVEIYNAGGTVANLSGYYISDDQFELQKWALPDVSVAAHGYLIIWANNNSTKLHANFKLDGDGEGIFLVDPSGNVIDSVIFAEQYPDISQGRFPDGGSWYMYSSPSPGLPNHADCFDLGNKPLEAVNFNPPPGFYSGEIEVNLSHPDAQARIFYTLNGSEPDTSDQEYTDPILLNSTKVLRAKAFRKDNLPGNDRSASYFINESFGLPVISLSFDSVYFWDRDIGIYLDENKSVDYSWERPVNLEIFDQRNPYISLGT